MWLKLNHVQKSFARPVLKDISYVFETGKLYVIKGVSGCGKTTLLNLLGGIDREYEGTIAWENDQSSTFLPEDSIKGQSCIANKKEVSKNKNRVGYVFQKSLLLDGLTIRENLLLIRNEPDRVKHLSEELGISDLLERLPSALSGGERQRVSVVRALLNDPQLILADEPTASLDSENSDRIAVLLSGLRRKDRIIIVATHEDCFDALADGILFLNYGVLEEPFDSSERIASKALFSEAENVQKTGTSSSYRKHRGSQLIRFSLKRHPERLRIKHLFPLAFAFLLLLLAGCFEACFSREATRLYAENFPMDIVMITPSQYRDFTHKEWLTVYDYLVAKEKDITAYYLMPETDSIFRINGMLLCGHFPQEENEVILSLETAEYLFPETDYPELVGKTFSFCGRTWIASAVATDRNTSAESNYMADIYYENAVGKTVFIPYDSLRTFAEVSVSSSGYLMATARGISADSVKRSIVESALSLKSSRPDLFPDQRSYVNLFYSQIDEYQERIDEIAGYTYLIMGVVSVLSCIYIASVIRVELFYRRREMGYLQIFGLSKREVFRSFVGEHAVRALAGLLVGFLLMGLLALLYGLFFKGLVYPSLASVAMCLGATVLYVISTGMVASQFLKKNARELITE